MNISTRQTDLTQHLIDNGHHELFQTRNTLIDSDQTVRVPGPQVYSHAMFRIDPLIIALLDDVQIDVAKFDR